MRKAIPKATVLVDIARFQPYSFQTKGVKNKFQPARYAAWLVPADGEGEIQIIDLGEADPIDKLVTLARQEIQNHGSVLKPSQKKPEPAAAQPQIQIAAAQDRRRPNAAWSKTTTFRPACRIFAIAG